MIIAGDDGTKFEMVSLGFEAFLPITGLDHRFWLRAKYRCEKKNNLVEGVSTCLVGYEVKELLQWLDDVGAGMLGKPILVFMEPYLQFELVPPEAPELLQIRWENSNPFPEEGSYRGQGMVLEFHLDQLNLKAAADHLRSELVAMPKKAKGAGCLFYLLAMLAFLFKKES